MNVKCALCKKIPLEILQCIECDAVICLQCKSGLIEDLEKNKGLSNAGFKAIGHELKCPIC